MERQDYLRIITTNGEQLAAAGRAGLAAAVPCCPGWSVENVLAHTGQVHRWVTGILEAAPGERVRFSDVPQPPEGAAVIDWFIEGNNALVESLQRADLSREVRTFAGERPARFWLSRMALENSMHRWDAESAHGDPGPLDGELCVEGMDEIFTVYVPSRFDTATFGGSGETMHLHATDRAGEWMITFEADQVTCEHGHGKGDVAVRGGAADLYLLMWNRIGTEGFEIFGDSALLDRWRQHATF